MSSEVTIEYISDEEAWEVFDSGSPASGDQRYPVR